MIKTLRKGWRLGKSGKGIAPKEGSYRRSPQREGDAATLKRGNKG